MMDTGMVLGKKLDPVNQPLNYSPGQYARYAVYGSVYHRAPSTTRKISDFGSQLRPKWAHLRKMRIVLAAAWRASRGADQRPVRAGYERKSQVF